nr:50S ribosomal protein L21 [Anaerolineae bacterium]
MYAVVRIGGRQYPVEPGKFIVVEKLPYDVGEQITFDDVLFVNKDGEILVGQPTVSGAAVTAEVTRQYRGKKVVVFKYKPKVRYRRKQGHRQRLTQLKIHDISVE